MRCAILTAPGSIEVGELPFGEVDGERIRISHVGICGSDLHVYRHGGIGSAQAAFPFVMGHEGVGFTDDNRRVALEPTINCTCCDQCFRGNPNLCRAQRFLSLPPDQGMLRETLRHPARLLVEVPHDIGDAASVTLEPLSVAIHAFDLIRFHAGASVAILGCGSMGLLCLMMARYMGAGETLCTDPIAARCEAALAFGASRALDSRQGVSGEYEYVIECSGDPGAHRDMLSLAAPGAKIAVVGTPPAGEINLVGHDPRRKGLTFYMVRRSRNTLHRAAQIAATKKLPLERLVTHIFPLDRAQEAFDTASEYRDGCLKVVIQL